MIEYNKRQALKMLDKYPEDLKHYMVNVALYNQDDSTTPIEVYGIHIAVAEDEEIVDEAIAYCENNLATETGEYFSVEDVGNI